MRVAIANVTQESCSFTPSGTSLDSFRRYGLYEGAEILDKLRGIGPIGGFLDEAERLQIDYTPVPLLYASGGAAGGPLTASLLDYLEERLTATLEQALPVDGLFLSLHGAAAAENDPDVEGHLLAAVRRILGPGVPIVSSFDHHGNVTQRMIDNVDGMVAHRTQPHAPYETGQLAARQLFAILRGNLKPTIAWRKIPMLAHQEQYATARGPMKAWFDRARAYEAEPGVVSVSPFPMQPWLDVPEGGWATVVVTNDDQALAERIADEHAHMAWRIRDRFWVYDSIPVEAAVRQAVAAERGVVLLSDTGDSVFGGSPGDSVHILAELIRQGVTEPAFLTVVDPAVADAAVTAGTGSEITVQLGGAVATAFHEPITVTARVAAIRSGPIEAEVVGMESFDMGRAALLDVGSIRIVVSEWVGIGSNHPVVFRSFGLDPATAKMIVMKTAANFQYYADVTSAVIRVDSPGPTMSHLEQFEWKRVPRPIYPLDDGVEF